MPDPPGTCGRGTACCACTGEEELLPQVIRWIGEDHVVTSADMPHAEAREHAMLEIRERNDLSESVKRKILSDNPRRFYSL